MRIIYCSDRYWPALGGAETYARTIAEKMAEKHTVKVITLIRDERHLVETLSKPRIEVKEDRGIQVVSLTLPPALQVAAQVLRAESFAHQLFKRHYYSIRSLWLKYAAYLMAFPLKKELKGADIIHSMAPWELSHAVNLVRGEIPHVVTGFLHPGNWGDDAESLKHFLRCDHVVALSNTERQSYLNLNIPEDRVSVVGVPVREAVTRDTQATWPFPSQIDNPFVLFLGAKRAYKGVDLLLEATRYVWERIPEAQFVFAGPRTSYSETLFAGIPFDPRIIELGAVSEAESWNLLKHCSLLCLPSETEIMPNVILEAWLMRKAVIVSDIPTLRELVRDAGLCVARNVQTLSKALVFLLLHPDVSTELGERGWEKCEHEHSAESVMIRLEDIYHVLTARYQGILEK